MKKILFGTVVILMSIGVGCTMIDHPYKDLGGPYTTDGRSVFCWNTKTLLPETDPNTFVFIDGKFSTYAKDATHVYLHCQVLPTADPKTFTLVEDGNAVYYSKDATHVYFEAEVIAGADPQTFTVLEDIHSGFFSKDWQHVYIGTEILTGADPETFPTPIPTVIGQCVTTTIAKVGERLGTPGSGSQIIYANGIFAVDYIQVPAMDQARVGDKIKLCLVELQPKDCPPGDERGKVYQAKDLRTGLSWTKHDSEHLCGGA